VRRDLGELSSEPPSHGFFFRVRMQHVGIFIMSPPLTRVNRPMPGNDTSGIISEYRRFCKDENSFMLCR
jgi:hypothetical protein